MKRRLALIANYCIIAALTVIIGIALMSPSASHDLFVFSYQKFAFIITLLLVLIYIYVSLSSQRYSLINAIATMALLSILIFNEVFVRFFPDLMPNSIAGYLPDEFRFDEAAKKRRMAEVAGETAVPALAGEGMLYHFTPHAHISEWGALEIDSAGYRNPGEMPQRLDVVVLGDSVTLAPGTKADIGANMRQSGLTARSLAMGGYGPQQYRDAYRRFIVDAKVQHRMVVVISHVPNDITDAQFYDAVQAVSGDWRVLAALAPMPSNSRLPYGVQFLVNLVFGLREQIHLAWTKPPQPGSADTGAAAASPPEMVAIRLPGRNPEYIPYTKFQLPEFSDDQIKGYRDSIRDIAIMARQSNAKMVMVAYPDTGEQCIHYADLPDDIKLKYIDDLKKFRERIFSKLPADVLLVGVGDALAEATAVEPIGGNIANMHPTDRGVRVLWDALKGSVLPELSLKKTSERPL